MLDAAMVAETASDAFFSGAVGRIQRTMLVLAVALTAGAFWVFGWRAMVGCACGCVIAYVNFVWLKRVVEAFSERITESAKQGSAGGIVARFLLRYALMAVAAYAIFSFSPASLNGLFAGLFLPVAAIACEAAYEAYMAVVRGL